MFAHKLKSVLFIMLVLVILGVFSSCDGFDLEASVTGIAVKTQPTKTEYALGESFSTAGLQIDLVFDDGTTQPLSATEYQIVAPNMKIAGIKTITVKCVRGELTYETTFSINVLPYPKHKISFSVDGTVLQTVEVREGAMPEYSGTPTKTPTAQYAYVFSGWSPAISAATRDANYSAIFREVLRKYDVTFKYGENILQSGSCDYGETPTYQGEIPFKAEEEHYTYQFGGWTPQLGEVTGETEYNAKFDKIPKNYLITFKNGDDVLKSTPVAYGTLPIYGESTPQKDPTQQYEYAFSGWDKEIVAVTGATAYQAQFESYLRKYPITWKIGMSTSVTRVEYGTAPQYSGETPTKAANAQYSYTFSGWSPSIKTVTGSATYTALFTSTLNRYIVSFKNGEQVMQSNEYEYGVKPTYSGATPTKAATVQYSFSFSGWSPSIKSVTGVATYEAVYTQTVNKYSVKFQNGNQTMQNTNYDYGAKPSYRGVTPTREATAQYSYTFSGWSPAISIVNGAQIYEAQYTATLRSYEIVFENGGTVLQTITPDYGTMPEYTGATPTKPSDVQYNYQFRGWSPALTSVIGEQTYEAQFSATLRQYTISFMNGEELLQSTQVEYGTVPEYVGTTPTKPSTVQYTYTFSDWSPSVESVTGDATYVAQYDQTVNSYVVTFKNGENTLQSREFSYGTMPEYYGDTPIKSSTAQYTYTFRGWSPALATVSGAQTYQAQFNATLRQYEIIFQNGADELQNAWFEYGSMPEYVGATPTKAATAQYTYTFSGWSPAISIVTGTQTYEAQYDRTLNSYTITFKNGEDTLQSDSYDYGETPTFEGEEPSMEATAQYTYAFSGWSPAISIVTGTQTYEAQFDRTLNSYTITFKNGEDTLQSDSYDYGETPVYEGAEPTKAAVESYTYRFNGWSPTLSSVTGTQIYVAQFEEIYRGYLITFKNGENTLQSREFSYGTMPEYTGATPTKPSTAECTYEFSGWSPTLASVSGEQIYIAQFKESVRKYLLTLENDNSAAGTVEGGGEYAYGTVPVVTATANDGYVFDGWYQNDTRVSTDNTYTLSATTSDVMIRAKWSAIVYSITYVGGSNTANPNNYTIKTATTTLLAPVALGEESFLGWYSEAGFLNKIETIGGGAIGNLTLHARWAYTYTLSFRVGSVTLSDYSVTAMEGESVSQPTVDGSQYDMTGYTIEKWYTTSAMTTEYAFSTMPSQNVTVYGEWSYSIVGEGFMQYLDEFSTGGMSNTGSDAILIDREEKLVSLIEYILFNGITDNRFARLDFVTGEYTIEMLDELFYKQTYGNCAYSRGVHHDTANDVWYAYISAPDYIVDYAPVRQSTGAIYEQQDYFMQSQHTSTRAPDYEGFKINSVAKTIEVTSSDQLHYVLEHGYRPMPVSGSPAEQTYELAKQVLRDSVDDTMSDIEKLRAIYLWLIDNVSYDHGAVADTDGGTYQWYTCNAWYLEGVFVDGRAVCDAITKAFVTLARIEGIPMVRVSGNGHAWNRVLVDGTWYAIDATWANMGINVSSNYYELASFDDFMFTDAQRAAEGYSTTKYEHLVADTAENAFSYFTFEYAGQEYDLIIESETELRALIEYCNSLEANYATPTTYITVEFAVTYTTGSMAASTVNSYGYFTVLNSSSTYNGVNVVCLLLTFR